jgi:hypothetical protein
MSRKNRPGSAFTIEESVPGDSRLTIVTKRPPSLLTSALKIKAREVFDWRVVVMRKESPLMPKTGDCLIPLPLVVFTTRAPGHSESGPGAFWSSRMDPLAGALSGALPESPAGALAGSLAGALTGALLGALGLAPVGAVVVGGSLGGRAGTIARYVSRGNHD